MSDKIAYDAPLVDQVLRCAYLMRDGDSKFSDTELICFQAKRAVIVELLEAECAVRHFEKTGDLDAAIVRYPKPTKQQDKEPSLASQSLQQKSYAGTPAGTLPSFLNKLRAELNGPRSHEKLFKIELREAKKLENAYARQVAFYLGYKTLPSDADPIELFHNATRQRICAAWGLGVVETLDWCKNVLEPVFKTAHSIPFGEKATVVDAPRQELRDNLVDEAEGQQSLPDQNKPDSFKRPLPEEESGAALNGFRKMQQRLREEGWYVEWALPCCQSCAWACVPEVYDSGPLEGEDFDWSRVLFNHEQDCEISCEYDEEKDELIIPDEHKHREYDTFPHLSPEEQLESSFCFDGSEEGVANLKAIIPVIEECGCKVEWDGSGKSRPKISWAAG